ncbi:MAG TPA: cyclic nucleotide-binding domain-containing protein [Alphaproteobacteria bacterium]|jgi:CRP/FNR family transcriptional regulator, cyclic AMP receptor protein|nr:cyclic nucleotide-binding domain-containing protein [Alphaproteobacteria bacterium]
MSLKEEVEILRNIPLFANLEASKLKLLAFTSERLTYHAGQILFRQGEPGDAAYIILSGEADVVVATPNGPLSVAKLGRNAVVGEIAILCDVPRTATVKAETEVVTLRVSKDLFFRLVMEFPQIGIEIMRVLANRLERTTVQLREALIKVGE